MFCCNKSSLQSKLWLCLAELSWIASHSNQNGCERFAGDHSERRYKRRAMTSEGRDQISLLYKVCKLILNADSKAQAKCFMYILLTW